MDAAQPLGQLAGQFGSAHVHAEDEFLGRGVEFVEIVLARVEVVAHLLVRHGDGPAATAVGEPVFRGGGQLRGGQPVAAVQVDHRAGHRRMRAHQVGDLRDVDVDAQVAIHQRLAQLGDQTGVVLRGEERRVDPEHLGDAQQHGDAQRPDVVLDLVEITGGDVEHLRQRGLAEAAFAAELTHP